MKIISFFAGAGGLDLGFEKSGFQVIWANEYDKTIWDTYEHNHPNTYLDKRDLRKIPLNEIPDCIGIIGGPPCQSWSEAGAGRGINDSRGKLFNNYIEVINHKNPLFFLAENVSGILHLKHRQALNGIIDSFETAGHHGYNVSVQLLNASDFGVPQDRKRVFFVGYRKDLDTKFQFPKPLITKKATLEKQIGDLVDGALPCEHGKTNVNLCTIPNHEYYVGSYSSIYMSRNRVRAWDEQSFTIQAGARHAPIHPQAPKMIFIEKNKRIFVPGKEELYRRLSVRECARIQTFTDDFIFVYNNIMDGYKMVGNAVPVDLAKAIALKIYKDILNIIDIVCSA